MSHEATRDDCFSMDKQGQEMLNATAMAFAAIKEQFEETGECLLCNYKITHGLMPIVEADDMDDEEAINE